MALSESTLADELENLTPTTDADAAVQTLADAYGDYMSDAVSNGIPILTVTAAVEAMADAMEFPLPGTASAAATAIAAGVSAFWAAMVSAPATYFTAATVITPPAGLSGLAAALQSVLVSNVGLSLADSAATMADPMHSASAAGTATFPGPVVFALV